MELPAGCRGIDEIVRDHEQNPRRKAALDRARGRLRRGFGLSQSIQIYFLHNDLTLSKVMLIILISAGIIFGIFFSKDAVTDGEQWVSLHPLKMEQSEGWTCILRNGDAGQHCYSEEMMQQIEMFRDEVHYLPKSE